MKLNKVLDISLYHEIVDQYGQKGCISNDYIQREVENLVEEGRLYESRLGRNAFLFVQKPAGLRVYFYLNDLNEKADFSDNQNLVIEILYRGEAFFPQELVSYFESCGFKSNLIRDQYAGMYKDLTAPVPSSDASVHIAKGIDEVRKACLLFNASFDALSGDYVPDSEYQKLVETNGILIACTADGAFAGALHQKVENNVVWIEHVAVVEQARGHHVGQTLLDAFVQQNMTSEKSRYMFWVQHQNLPAVAMYQKKGFKYIGKSTISLIKQ